MNGISQIYLIERLGAQGDGIAAAEGGGEVYVPLALPGERVRAGRLGDRARLEAVLEPSEDRIAPPCLHFGNCGGCALQHAQDAYVARWKHGLVASALAARGIAGVEVRPLLTSPPHSRRRIALAARRARKGMLIGFHAPGSAQIVPVSECAVAAPALIRVLPALEEIVLHGASRRSELRVTLTLSASGIDAAIGEAPGLSPPQMALLAGMAARAGLARLSWNGEVAVTISEPVQRMGRARVVPPPGAFLQPTAEGEAALLAAVAEAVGPARRIADLFAGCGTFALPLAERAEVLAAESDGPALAALEAGWRGAPGLHGLRTERRDLFARPLRPADLKGIEAVVLDPPRAGARAQTEQICAAAAAGAGPARIASVSCNPATFARDARLLLDAGYALDWVQPVDQFRWSPHLELVGAFSR